MANPKDLPADMRAMIDKAMADGLTKQIKPGLAHGVGLTETEKALTRLSRGQVTFAHRYQPTHGDARRFNTLAKHDKGK